jgi:pilus assembly protein Flp/PilA
MFALTYLQMLALRLRKDKSGAVATEYAFLIAFIAIVAAIGMTLLGTNLSAFFNVIGLALLNAGSNIPDPFSGT